MALRGYTISNHSDQHDRDIQTLFKYHEDVLASLKSLTEGTVTWREEDAYRQDQEKRMNEALADIQRNLQYLRNGQTYNRNVLEGWRRPLEDH
jgi:hypothetical protein